MHKALPVAASSFLFSLGLPSIGEGC